MRLLLPAMIVAVSMVAVPHGEEPLHYVGSIELARVEGRIDHLAFDAVHQRLFVAALGNNTVEVIDVNSHEHLRSLPGFREPQGIAVATDANIIGVANGEGEGIQLLDAEDFHRVRSVVLGDDSDNARYDSEARLLYVGYGSGAVAVVRSDDGKVVGTVKLNGHPESFQLEKASTRLYVNVPTADQIAVIDRKAMKVVTTWPVRGAKANFPMALDEANHRLFIGCRRPAKVLIVDTASGSYRRPDSHCACANRTGRPHLAIRRKPESDLSGCSASLVAASGSSVVRCRTVMVLPQRRLDTQSPADDTRPTAAVKTSISNMIC